MQENVFNHDHFNTWQACPMRYYFKYVKKVSLPELEADYELGQKVHALMDYKLRGFDIDHLIKDATDEIKACWDQIKDYPLLNKPVVKTEWAFDTKIGNSKNWLSGRIDAIFFDPETGKYTIADWKTGKYVPKKIEPNFQHKIYLYAFYASRKDLELEFKPEDLEFSYIEVKDEIKVHTIKFSEEEKTNYENLFLNIINRIQEGQDFNTPEACPHKYCDYTNLCY